MGQLHCVLLLLLSLAAAQDSKNRSRGSRSGGSSGSSSDSDGDGTTGGIVAGVILAFIVIVSIIYYFYRRRKRYQEAHAPVEKDTWLSECRAMPQDGLLDVNLRCTIFRGNYSQHGTSYPLDPFHVQFATTDGAKYKITGRGTDETGQYALDGELSHFNGRITMNKMYTSGAGNTVLYRLEWESATQEFVGTYHQTTGSSFICEEFKMRGVHLTEDVTQSEYTRTAPENQFYYANFINKPQQAPGQVPVAYPAQPGYNPNYAQQYPTAVPPNQPYPNVVPPNQQYPPAVPANQPYPAAPPQPAYNPNYPPQQYPAQLAQPAQPQYAANPTQITPSNVQMVWMEHNSTADDIQPGQLDPK